MQQPLFVGLVMHTPQNAAAADPLNKAAVPRYSETTPRPFCDYCYRPACMRKHKQAQSLTCLEARHTTPALNYLPRLYIHAPHCNETDKRRAIRKAKDTLLGSNDGNGAGHNSCTAP